MNLTSIMSSVWGDLRLGLPKPETPDIWASAVNTIKTLIGDCPVCNLPLDGHSWLTLAQAGNKEDMDQLTESSVKRDWAKLTGIDSFVGDRNTIIALAIDCPSGTGFTFEYIDWWELAAPPPTKLRCFVLSQEQWQELINLLPYSHQYTWRSLSSGSPVRISADAACETGSLSD